MRYFNHISIHSISTGLHAVYTKRVIFRAPIVYGLYPVAINWALRQQAAETFALYRFFVWEMQGYSFAPPSGPQGRVIKVSILRCMTNCCHVRRLESKRVLTENTRVLDYVFVDEHNRHKRLKGMRSLHVLDWWASI